MSLKCFILCFIILALFSLAACADTIAAPVEESVLGSTLMVPLQLGFSAQLIGFSYFILFRMTLNPILRSVWLGSIAGLITSFLFRAKAFTANFVMMSSLALSSIGVVALYNNSTRPGASKHLSAVPPSEDVPQAIECMKSRLQDIYEASISFLKKIEAACELYFSFANIDEEARVSASMEVFGSLIVSPSGQSQDAIAVIAAHDKKLKHDLAVHYPKLSHPFIRAFVKALDNNRAKALEAMVGTNRDTLGHLFEMLRHYCESFQILSEDNQRKFRKALASQYSAASRKLPSNGDTLSHQSAAEIFEYILPLLEFKGLTGSIFQISQVLPSDAPLFGSHIDQYMRVLKTKFQERDATNPMELFENIGKTELTERLHAMLATTGDSQFTEEQVQGVLAYALLSSHRSRPLQDAVEWALKLRDAILKNFYASFSTGSIHLIDTYLSKVIQWQYVPVLYVYTPETVEAMYDFVYLPLARYHNQKGRNGLNKSVLQHLLKLYAKLSDVAPIANMPRISFDGSATLISTLSQEEDWDV